MKQEIIDFGNYLLKVFFFAALWFFFYNGFAPGFFPFELCLWHGWCIENFFFLSEPMEVKRLNASF